MHNAMFLEIFTIAKLLETYAYTKESERKKEFERAVPSSFTSHSILAACNNDSDSDEIRELFNKTFVMLLLSLSRNMAVYKCEVFFITIHTHTHGTHVRCKVNIFCVYCVYVCANL